MGTRHNVPSSPRAPCRPAGIRQYHAGPLVTSRLTHFDNLLLLPPARLGFFQPHHFRFADVTRRQRGGLPFLAGHGPRTFPPLGAEGLRARARAGLVVKPELITNRKLLVPRSKTFLKFCLGNFSPRQQCELPVWAELSYSRLCFIEHGALPSVVERSGERVGVGPCGPAQGRTGERASEMESYGVCVSAREMQGRGSRLSLSLALTQTPQDSISLARARVRHWPGSETSIS